VDNVAAVAKGAWSFVMPGTHGELFTEIGRLVIAADAGAPIDLRATSEDLAERYDNLGFPAATMARAIARSLGAVGVSMTLIGPADDRDTETPSEVGERLDGSDEDGADAANAEGRSTVLLPSGVRLAVLS
jgi:hypothetical protein